MKEPLKLQGFRFADSPVAWELAPVDHEMISLGQLLTRFYRLFDLDLETYYPLAWVRDPIQKNGEPAYVDPVIQSWYRRGFYVVIEKNRLFGPHGAFLYYKCEQLDNEAVWVATLQIKAMFYDDKTMQEELLCGIRLREFYHSETTALTTVIK